MQQTAVTGRPSATPATTHRPSKVRADIQALRALAVVLVVVSHFWPGRLPGGYVGVDVFFVISGFLITNHLLAELESTGRLQFARFYIRRARRLLPAAFLVSLVSLAAVVVLMPASTWRTAAEETAAATVYMENWLLAGKSIDYSAHNAAASTVQHYWSLSVEEQFYLVWPLFLLLVLVLARKLGKPNHRRMWTIGITVVTLLSFAYAVYFTAVDRSPAYFVTTTRVWEFGVGALLAVLATRLRVVALRPGGRAAVLLLQWGGLAAVVVAAVLFDGQTAFPGPMAAVPVLGTAAVILAGSLAPTASSSWVFRPRPIQYLGDISYSLYLWHWPLILLAPYVLSRVPGLVDRLGILAIAIALAALTKALVEDPGRRRLLAKASGRRFLAVFVASVVTMLVASGAVLLGGRVVLDAQAAQIEQLAEGSCFGAEALTGTGCTDPFGPPKATNAGEDEAPWFSAPECADDPDPIIVEDAVLLQTCDFSSGRSDAPIVWLVGDSHAEQWKVVVFELAREHGWIVRQSVQGGCPLAEAPRVAFNGQPGGGPAIEERCMGWSEQVSQRIVDDRPDLVLVSTFGAGETIDDGSGADQQTQYRNTLLPRVSAWADAAGTVVAIRDTPLTLARSTPECLQLNRGDPLACANPRATALVDDPASAAVAADPRARVLDLSDQFCDEDTCYAAIGGIMVYFDLDHVSRSYMKSLIPVFEARLTDAVGDLGQLARRPEA